MLRTCMHVDYEVIDDPGNLAVLQRLRSELNEMSNMQNSHHIALKVIHRMMMKMR